jgi:hypothetical protein
VPVRFELPPESAPGQIELSAEITFDTGEKQRDAITLHILPPPEAPSGSSKIALFDPRGETGAWLDKMGIRSQRVDAVADLSGYHLLIVGKSAFTVQGPAPSIAGVRDGLKVLLFEQSSEVLEQRFGFRVAEQGLRWVFKRVPDHPALSGLSEDHLRNWRGAATILPPRLTYELRPRHGPTVQWCGLPVTRLWRCGNRGSVASVLIEKPARGDFLPILEGGFGLQYSPLLEYREGQGMVLFCQMDVTGRTEADPAAERLGRNLLEHVQAWKPSPARQAVWAGDAEGRQHLESAGLAVNSYDGGGLSSNHVLVVGPRGGEALANHKAAVAGFLGGGGHLLAIGLDGPEANAFLPFKVAMRKEEHIAAYFEPFGRESLLAGVGPADVHNRDPRELFLLSGGAAVTGAGVLATRAAGNESVLSDGWRPKADGANVVFCQLVPWHFDLRRSANLKRTHRRTACLVTRLLANMGVRGSTPLLSRFSKPVTAVRQEGRWLEGFYLDRPEEWDDPYRFFRW